MSEYQAEASRPTSSDLHELKEDLSRVKDDLSSLAGTIMERGKESARAMRDAVKERANSSLHAVESAVEQRPLTMVLMAFAAGAVCALLLRRK